MLDLDNGKISFSLNGLDLGIAFSNIDQSATWFPSISLGSRQHAKFYFGSDLHQLL